MSTNHLTSTVHLTIKVERLRPSRLIKVSTTYHRAGEENETRYEILNDTEATILANLLLEEVKRA